MFILNHDECLGRTSAYHHPLSPSKKQKLELLRKIESINIGFEVNDGKIFYQKGNELLRSNIENGHVESIAKLETEFYGINIVNESIVLVSPKGFQVIDSEGNLSEYILIESGIGDYKLKNSKSLIITEKDSENWKQSLMNPINNSILWSAKEKERIEYSRQNFYVINNEYISKRDEYSGSKIWEYQYNEEGFQPLTIKSNQNYCLICLLNKDLLICIDNKTGNEKWKQTTIPKGILIDNNEDIAHQLLINYNCIELDSGQIIKQKIDREYFRDLKIENQKSNLVQYENQLIANDSRSKRTGNLDLNDLKFKSWVDGISVPEGYKMKTDNDFLFLQGMDKTLNILKMKAR